MSAERATPRLSRATLFVGVVVVVAGAVVVAVPGVARYLPGSRPLVLGVAAATLLAGVVLARQRRRAERDAAETGDPECRRPFPTPGTELETDLRRIDRVGRIATSSRRRIRKRLHRAATAAVGRREGVSRETASRRIATGKWTDDPLAASFLGGEDLAVDLSTRERLTALLSARSREGLGARRTARAIVDLAADTNAEDSNADADTNADDDGLADDLRPGPASAAPSEPVDRETGRWTGVGALALVSGGLGVAVSRPALVLASVVGVAYAAYAFRGRPPAVDLAVERRLTPVDEAAPAETATAADADADATAAADGGRADGARLEASTGDRVRVTVIVENAGTGTLSDLRLVDGVPPGLTVVDGSPRLGTALRPGRTATLSYVVEAERGRHEFGPLQVIARDASGAGERERAVEAPGELACVREYRDPGTLPLYGTATRYTGRVPTETGGDGVEFYATREYRPGDPPGRIDWNRHARTRELATLLFREERAATVVMLVDARETAYRAPGPGEAHAVARSVHAAGRIFEGLLAGGDRVGLASFGPRAAWVAPGAGSDQRRRVRRALAEAPAFADDPPKGPFLPSARLADVRRRTPSDAQFVLFTPAVDDYVVTVARRLWAYGHPVTVVSPDVTTDRTTGHRIARIERGVRLNDLREAGVRVVDWHPDEDLAVALRRAEEAWSR
ncbi:MAG: DUF58 domain-containing protein [Halobacteriales archaeon]